MSIPLIFVSGWAIKKAGKDWGVVIVSCGFFIYFLSGLSYLPIYTDKLVQMWINLHSPVNILMNCLIAIGVYYGRISKDRIF